MNFVEIKPKGRDAKAKALYIFLSWYTRCNRYDLERRVKRDMRNLMLFGTTHPEVYKESI